MVEEMCGIKTVFLQTVLNLALEMVFPACCRKQLKGKDKANNEAQLSALRDGSAYNGIIHKFWSGSVAESLCVEWDWCHGVCDIDVMYLCGKGFGVYVPDELGLVPCDAELVFRPEECPSGYCRLQLWGLRRPSERYAHVVERADGKLWLNTENMVKEWQPEHSDSIKGPAASACQGSWEEILALVCSGPHPAMEAFVNRHKRDWPTQDQLKTLLQLPMLVVPVGHKQSHDSRLQARISWSIQELVLISSLPDWIKQGYVAFKYTYKFMLKRQRGDCSSSDGRSFIGSYHLKTVLLHYLEKNPPSLSGSPIEIFLGLLDLLTGFLSVGRLPNFFLPECDLLNTVKEPERVCSLKAAQKVLAHPLEAMLLSLQVKVAQQCGVKYRDVLKALKQLAASPECPENRARLRQFEVLIDANRESMHQSLQRKDLRNDIRDRPGLPRLMDMLDFASEGHHTEHGSAEPSGPRLNIKTVLSTYGDFHVKDKTAVRTSYL